MKNIEIKINIITPQLWLHHTRLAVPPFTVPDLLFGVLPFRICCSVFRCSAIRPSVFYRNPFRTHVVNNLLKQSFISVLGNKCFLKYCKNVQANTCDWVIFLKVAGLAFLSWSCSAVTLRCLISPFCFFHLIWARACPNLISSTREFYENHVLQRFN